MSLPFPSLPLLFYYISLSFSSSVSHFYIYISLVNPIKRKRIGETDGRYCIDSGLVRGVARAPDIDPEDMAVMLGTNVTGLVNMTQAILPIFLARPDGGRGDIINVGSIAGKQPPPPP